MTHSPTVINHRPKPVPELNRLGRQSQTRAQIETALAEIYAATGFSPSSDPRTDFETGIEEILRTHAALKACDPQLTWFHLLDPKSTTTVPEPLADQGTLSGPHRVYGPSQSSMGRRGHRVDEDELDYWTLEAFRSRAGRAMVLAGFDPDDGSADVVATVSSLFGSTSPKRPFFIKPTSIKSYPAEKAWIDRFDMLQTSTGAWDWASVSLEGRAGTALVQESVPMQYEYRFFIVGAELVAGAGCLGELNPLHNQTRTRFDPRMRKLRGPITRPAARTALLETYLSFAAEAAADIAAERPQLDYYTLDVALGQNDQPLIIELNPAGAAGFYAADPYAVAEACFTG